jgi:hypothetical protein
MHAWPQRSVRCGVHGVTSRRTFGRGLRQAKACEFPRAVCGDDDGLRGEVAVHALAAAVHERERLRNLLQPVLELQR